jgi:hypothetical protein
MWASTLNPNHQDIMLSPSGQPKGLGLGTIGSLGWRSMAHHPTSIWLIEVLWYLSR